MKTTKLLIISCCSILHFAPCFIASAQNLPVNWSKSIGGIESDNAIDVATDFNNNTYLIGYFKGVLEVNGQNVLMSNGGSDIYIIKCNSSGSIMWVRQIGGIGTEEAVAIECDLQGNIYSTGVFNDSVDFDPGSGIQMVGASGNDDIFIQKLNSGGELLWADKIGGTSLDEPHSICTDLDGNVFLTGRFFGTTDFDPSNSSFYNLTSFGSGDIFVLKLLSTGGLGWVKQMGGSGDEGSRDIRVDGNGNIYTIGYFQGTVDFDPGSGVYNLFPDYGNDIFISKLNAQGNFIYALQFAAEWYSDGKSLAVDELGNVYSTGSFEGTIDFDPSTGYYPLTSSGAADIFICKTTPNGNLDWVHQIGDGASPNSGKKINLDQDGALIITGYFQEKVDFDPGPNIFEMKSDPLEMYTEAFLLKLGPDGIFKWAYQANCTSLGSGISFDLGPDDNIVLVGDFYDSIKCDINNPNYNVLSAGSKDGFAISYSLSSFISISNHIENNIFFSNDEILYSGPINLQATPLKVCSDGSVSTHFELFNHSSIPSANIKYRIKSDPNGNNLEELGQFTIMNVSNDTVYAEYTHPKYVNSNYKPYRKDTIEIYNSLDIAEVAYKIPLQIYRAPILFVHGWLGSSGTFEMMFDTLKQKNYYDEYLMLRADYKTQSINSFESNAAVVPKWIDFGLELCRSNSYSAGKVDIIAHSLGGVLSRLYLQGNYLPYRGDISRLILLNTPNSGSQLADFAIDNGALFCYPLNWIYDLTDSGCPESVVDLQVQGIAIDDILNGPLMNANIVPTHVITSEEDASDQNIECTALTIVFKGRSLLEFFHFVDNIFEGKVSDLVVTDESQDGGIVGDAKFHIIDQCHVGSSQNPDIISHCKTIVSTNPSSTEFTMSGFSPVDLDYFGIPPINEFDPTLRTGDVTIVSPANGDIFEPGQLLSIEVSGTSNVNKLTLLVGNNSLPLFALETFSNQSIFEYIIPDEGYGELRIIVTGIDEDTNFVDLDTIKLNIITNASLDNLSIYPNQLVVPQGNQIGFSLTGYFSDGISRDLSAEPTIEYTVVNSSIAQYVFPGAIQGLIIDTTKLLVNYQGKSLEVPIKVYDGSGLTNIFNPLYNSGIINSNLVIYPNPIDKSATIEFILDRPSNILFLVFDLYGEIIYQSKSKQSKGTNQLQLDGSNLPSGIYFVELRSEQQEWKGKIIILK